MKTQLLALSVAVFMPSQLFVGQVTSSANTPEDAKVMAQQLVENIKHSRPEPRGLRGRDDVLVELKKLTDSLSIDDRRRVLFSVLCIGRQKDQQRWILSSAVTAYLVEVATSADDAEVREYAGDLLVKYMPPTYIRVHAAALIKATEEGKLGNSLLLGKTGAEEARRLIEKGGKLRKASGSGANARAAAAKLGDTSASKAFVDAYRRETDPGKKARLAKTLGYIGDAACVLTLARDMRTPVIYIAGGVMKSLRVDIAAALSEVYPHESVLWWRGVQGNKEVDEWYDAIEKWLTGYLGITWKAPRPEPYAVVPIPTPQPPR